MRRSTSLPITISYRFFVLLPENLILVPSEMMAGERNLGGDPRRRQGMPQRRGPGDNEVSVSRYGGCSNRAIQTIIPTKSGASLDSRSGACSSQHTECDSEIGPFDICMRRGRSPVKLNLSLLEVNRERRREQEFSKTVPQKLYLRPGMVLLKNFIKHHDQVRIIKICQELGIGPGGFYKPGYGDGAKLHLQMMCLGKNWDPEKSLYEDKRSYDGAMPPKIPVELKKLVEDAIQASHDFLGRNEKGTNVDEELPRMSPDICIVNFYNSNGRLGLHQDKDESKSSLRMGLPVVSFSLGDSAEFLYGVERNTEKAEKVQLDSGDVLLFGGKSRHIFHGVPHIKPKTAPKRLIEETKLRPGRLNLTFRQY
ncbi:DNA N(6)-methyladenine demethylase ALKBH1D-like isoform X2 [Typha angustifolia]|uniref:DNA N(6)-methyladenine demethylase ALKBH1D-like isoform X2 n=1 Tax=Typha angustifolia TaxID=59011 RepID=UPI003C2B56C4